MAFDVPPIQPQPSSNEIRHESAINMPPPEERPLITHLMPFTDRAASAPSAPDGDKVVQLAAANDKPTQNAMDKDLKTSGFETISMPDNWQMKEMGVAPPGYLFRADAPKAADTHISVYSRGRSLNSDDQHAIKSAIDSAQGKPKLLFDSSWDVNGTYKNDPARKQAVEQQMKSLAGVLGESQLGDNQFTNNKRPPDPGAPVFHIERAEVQNINGKQVLAIEGYYPSIKDGSPERFFTGIFAPKDEGGGTVVHEAFLQSNDKMQFVANKAPFRKTLNSIHW
jgi:hypothetical protein